jgi:DNA phosphorothioation-associated putative methyltransferase
LLNASNTFFDYGCGWGDDLEHVRQLGIHCGGWDPAHRPNHPRDEADVVNLGYVINVIEDLQERSETLRAAWNLSRKVLTVAARISVDGANDGEYEYGDGVITRLQTFQKFFSQTELRLYLEQTLGTEAVPAAPGVFYLFKDCALRETFAAAKYRRRGTTPRGRAFALAFERHRDLLEDLIRLSAELGRLPYPDEFESTADILAHFGSLKRAFTLIKKVTGTTSWDSIHQKRIDDQLVYYALARFTKRPKLAQLTLRMQRDVKEFFGGYKNACEQADKLLFDAGKAELIDAACLRAEIGRLTSNALYVHRSAVPSLEPILRVYEGCARAYLGDMEDANVVKLHRFSGKVSYVECPDFEDKPHPKICRVFKVSLRNLYCQCIDHTTTKDPLLLDHKEFMIESDHPWRERFGRFSALEAQHGLLEGVDDLLTAFQWDVRLQAAGLTIRGNRLLYREGVKRKRLPTQKLARSSDASADQQPVVAESQLFELNDLSPIAAIDEDLELELLPENNRRAELPGRSRRFGVGKEIGYAVYVHRDYEEVFGPTVEWAKRHLPDYHDYTVVKLNQRNNAVSFVYCPGFDVEPEPAICSIISVAADGTVQRFPRIHLSTITSGSL